MPLHFSINIIVDKLSPMGKSSLSLDIIIGTWFKVINTCV
jgi:hypothetical protein